MAINIFTIKLKSKKLSDDSGNEEMLSVAINQESMIGRNLFISAIFKEIVYGNKSKLFSFSHEEYLESIDYFNQIIVEYIFKGSYKATVDRLMKTYEIDSISVYGKENRVMFATLKNDKVRVWFSQ